MSASTPIAVNKHLQNEFDLSAMSPAVAGFWDKWLDAQAEAFLTPDFSIYTLKTQLEITINDLQYGKLSPFDTNLGLRCLRPHYRSHQQGETA